MRSRAACRCARGTGSRHGGNTTATVARMRARISDAPRLGDRQLHVLAVYGDAACQQQWARRQAGAARHRAVVSRSHDRERQRAALAGQRRSVHRSPVADLPSRNTDEEVAARSRRGPDHSVRRLGSAGPECRRCRRCVRSACSPRSSKSAIASCRGMRPTRAGRSSCRRAGTITWRRFRSRTASNCGTWSATCSNPTAFAGTRSLRHDELHARLGRAGRFASAPPAEPRRAGCFASRSFHDFHREVVDRLLSAATTAHVVAGAGRRRRRRPSITSPTAQRRTPIRAASIRSGWRRNRAGCRRSRCLQAAIDEGHRRIDFLRGDEPYKAHWRADPQPTYDYRVVPNRRLARLRGRVLLWSDSVVDWMRHASAATTGIVYD